MTASFDALGTTVVVGTVDAAELDTARAAVAAELDVFDRACSRFRSDSELSRVNGSDGATVPIGPVLREALRTAMDAAAATRGLVDPTVGRSLRLAGYDATFRVVASRDPGSFAPHFCIAPGWQVIELDEERGTVRVPRGVELDLGSTGKALAADRAAAAAADAVAGGVLVSVGGDISVTGNAPDGGWPIRIADNHAMPLSAPGPTVAITSGGLATSSITVRRWQTKLCELHHVLDPRTGLPANGQWRTVSVAAASCVHANTASTAALILDEDALRWLRERALPARLDRIDGTTEYVAAWPQDAT